MNKRKMTSAHYAAILTKCLTIDEMPIKERTHSWWDEFWYYYGLSEARWWRLRR